MTIDEALVGLRKRVKLPTGVKIEKDENTDNILVYRSDLGFAVTGRYCLDHDIDHVVGVVEQTLAKMSELPFLQSTAELLNPPTQTWFDS